LLISFSGLILFFGFKDRAYFHQYARCYQERQKEVHTLLQKKIFSEGFKHKIILSQRQGITTIKVLKPKFSLTYPRELLVALPEPIFAYLVIKLLSALETDQSAANTSLKVNQRKCFGIQRN